MKIDRRKRHPEWVHVDPPAPCGHRVLEVYPMLRCPGCNALYQRRAQDYGLPMPRARGLRALWARVISLWERLSVQS
jgi:hypothetical protein